MKTISIQANKIVGKDNYVLSVSTTDKIERAIFIDVTIEDLEDLKMMMED